MAKKDYILFIEKMIKRLEDEDLHKAPKKGVSSGTEGVLFEAMIKLEFNCVHGKPHSKPGKIDLRKNGYNIEVKQGLGAELGHLDENGNLTSPLFKSDYICYCPNFSYKVNINKQCYILPVSVFLEGLKSNNLTRVKPSTDMQARKKAGLKWFYNRYSIQANSIKKETAIFNFLEKNSMSIAEFLLLPNKKDL